MMIVVYIDKMGICNTSKLEYNEILRYYTNLVLGRFIMVKVEEKLLYELYIEMAWHNQT
jgi:hypothetical protein